MSYRDQHFAFGRNVPPRRDTRLPPKQTLVIPKFPLTWNLSLDTWSQDAFEIEPMPTPGITARLVVRHFSGSSGKPKNVVEFPPMNPDVLYRLATFCADVADAVLDAQDDFQNKPRRTEAREESAE